jgi:protein-histidine pros-kinase
MPWFTGNTTMGLLLRINLILGVVFIAAALIAGYACWTILDANSRRNVLAEAGLMMDSAAAVRVYTSAEILPLLDARMKSDFAPQSIPSYAATQNFLRLRERHPDFFYKEATLNPTNPRDRAADWEADIVQRFRNDAHTAEVTGDRDTPMGRQLFLARPIRTDGSCVECHGKAADAPPTLVARYGANNGFGWQNDEIVGAQVIAVPYADATASAAKAFHGFMGTLLGVFAAVLLVVNGVLYGLVVRPLRRIARVADSASVGDPSTGDFPEGGVREVNSIVRSFTRLRRSLEKAMHLLEAGK